MDTTELRRWGRTRLVGDSASKAAAAAFVEAARGRGMIDVAYGHADSPFGTLFVAVTRNGVVRVEYPDHPYELALEELAEDVSPRVLESPRATERVRRELEEYFAGRRRGFDLPVDLSLVRGFGRKVLSATARIPFGTTATYRDVATRAGNARAMRAAGNALGANPIPIVVPCHRVVRTGGGLGGYTGGLDRKVTLLRLEGALDA